MKLQLTKAIGGALAAGAIGFITALGTARSSFQPQPPDPGLLDVTIWLLSGQDLVAAFIAIASGISAGWAIWQMFQPAPATVGDVNADGDRTRAAVETVASDAALNAAELMRRLTDIEEMIAQAHVATAGEAADFANAAGELARSDDAIDAEIAQLLAARKFREAYDRAMAVAYGVSADAAAKARQAAKIIAPFDRPLAIAALRRALSITGPDFGVLIELSRVHQAMANYPSAQKAAQEALDAARHDGDRLIAIGELGDIAHFDDDLDEAERQYAAAQPLVDAMAEAEPDKLSVKINQAVQLEKRGDIASARGDHKAAIALYQQQVERSEAIKTAKPHDLVTGLRCTAHDKLAMSLGNEDRWEEAADHARHAVDYARARVAMSDGDADPRLRLAQALSRQGYIAISDNQPASAIAPSAEARDLFVRLAADQPDDRSLAAEVEREERNLALAKQRVANPSDT